MTKITFFHGVIFRIIVSLSAYGMIALYSHEFDVIVGGGTLLAAVIFMIAWAIQVSLIARGIPIDPSIVKKAMEEEEEIDDMWVKRWHKQQVERLRKQQVDPMYDLLPGNIWYRRKY